ncbi:MAG: murein biosynthesis integral membrane protein MurJ [Clostridia bacterium]|nr:murein biosynthesis integral membrane protein MurJ [Clostridia bacterium]
MEESIFKIKYITLRMVMKKSIFSQAIIVILISMFGKLLGLLRETALAAYFGASGDSDAFKISYSIPEVFIYIISIAIAQTFIPVYSDILTENDNNKTKVFLNNVFTSVTFAVAILLTIAYILSPTLVSMIAPGFEQITTNKTIVLARILIPASLFFVLSDLAAAYLQTNKRYITPSLVWYPHNLAIILSILFFNSYGIYAVGLGAAIGIFGMFLIQVPSLVLQGFVYKPYLNFKEEGIIAIKNLIIPVIISGSFNQLYLIINRILASGLGKGSVSAIDYAARVSYLVYSIFVISLSQIVYPLLAKSNDNLPDFTYKLGKSIRIISILVFPIVTMMFVLKEEIIVLVYQRGAFTLENTNKTAIAFAGLTFGVIGMAYREILNKAFYALKDTKTPMLNSIQAVFINILLNIILTKLFGLFGLALGSSSAFILSSCLLFVKINKKIGDIRFKWISEGLIKYSISSIIMGFIMYFACQYIIGAFGFSENFIYKSIIVLIPAFLGFAVYSLMLFVTKAEEAFDVITRMKKMWLVLGNTRALSKN